MIEELFQVAIPVGISFMVLTALVAYFFKIRRGWVPALPLGYLVPIVVGAVAIWSLVIFDVLGKTGVALPEAPLLPVRGILLGWLLHTMVWEGLVGSYHFYRTRQV